jgi:hypothetical protein
MSNTSNKHHENTSDTSTGGRVECAVWRLLGWEEGVAVEAGTPTAFSLFEKNS